MEYEISADVLYLTLYSVTYLHRSTFLEYSFFAGEILQRYKSYRNVNIFPDFKDFILNL